MAYDLEVRNLSKVFGQTAAERFVAVNDVSFTVEEGELFSLLGPSGCGKTTTLRMIAGLETVTSGQIFFGGRDLTLTPTSQRGLGMVFQSYALYPHMNVFENVAYALRVRRTPGSDVRSLVSEALALVGLAGYESRKPSELSGGQQQRVALARSLVYKPKVLLFDEPLSNLDAKLRVYMRNEIRKVQQQTGITAVYVTHDQEEALAMSDRIAIMRSGVIEQVGTPQEVYEEPGTVGVADFIGEANLLEVSVLTSGSGQATVRLRSGEELQTRLNDASVSQGERAMLVVRPERMSIEAAAGQPEGNALVAEVTDVVYLGNRTRYEIKLRSGELLEVDSVRVVPGVDVGATVRVKAHPSEALTLKFDEAYASAAGTAA